MSSDEDNEIEYADWYDMKEKIKEYECKHL